MKENATHALGFLLVGDEKFPHHKKLIDGLCEASKVMTTYFCFVSFQPFGNQGNPKENDMCINVVILLHEKFLQFDWLRAVVFQLNLKYLNVKITNLLMVVVYFGKT